MPQLEHNTCISQQCRQSEWEVTKVKQPQDQSYSKMSDHLGSIQFVFLQWQKY